jgi:subtilase family serine protease
MNMRQVGGGIILVILMAATAMLASTAVLAANRGAAAVRQNARPDLTLALEATAPDWPRNDVFVTVTLKNLGDVPCPGSVCRVYIRNAHPPRQTMKRVTKDIRPLDPGDHFAFSFKIRVSLGTYEIEAVADLGNKIAERDETNNSARITVSGR